MSVCAGGRRCTRWCSGRCDPSRCTGRCWRVGLRLFSTDARRGPFATRDCHRSGTLHERRLD
ncbi:MAG TPA: hypothetical protein DCR54_00110 [Chloroflexi bacterium]|nr:hypothetical protein [Chloroflexota bacterium]